MHLPTTRSGASSLRGRALLAASALIPVMLGVPGVAAAAPAPAALDGAATERLTPPPPAEWEAVPETVAVDPTASTSSTRGEAEAASAPEAASGPAPTASVLGEALASDEPVMSALAAPAPATQTITFSEHPVGSTITDAYQDRGVLFGSPGGKGVPFISPDGSNPTSPVLSGSPRFNGDIAALFVVPGTTQATTVDTVSVDVGYIDSPGSVQVLLFTSDGVEVLSADQRGINRLTATVPDVYAFEVVQSAEEPSGFAIDNVTFVPGTEPADGLAGGTPDVEELNGEGNPASRLVVCGIVLCADPVNTATGNFTETYDDVSVAQQGPGLSMQRTYNSVSAGTVGWFGHGWSSTWEARVTVEGGRATVRFGNGSTAEFFRTPVGWFGAPRVLASLSTRPGGGYSLVLDRRTTLTFDAAGQLVRVADLNGRYTQLSRPQTDVLVAADETGRTVTLRFAGGRVQTVRDPAGIETGYAYDAAGDLVQVTAPEGDVRTFGYDARHRIVRMEDAVGGTVLNDYDDLDRVVRQVGPSGTTSFAYADDATTISQPDGTVTVHRFEHRLLVEETTAAGTAEQATWRYAYDPYTGGRTREERPDGAALSRTFDAAGNLSSTTDPEGRVHSYTYDALGNRTSTTYPSGRRDVAQYDSRGNLMAVTEDAGRLALTTAFSRDADGDLTRSVSPRGALSLFGTDAAGLVVAVTDPDGKRVSLTYDALGRETSRVLEADPSAPGASGSRRTSTTWDDRSRVRTQTDAHGGVTTSTHDAGGRLVTVVGPRGERIDHEYDLAGHRVETRVGDDVVGFTYDAAGRVLSQVDPDGGVSEWDYDALGRVTLRTDPADRSTATTYDLAGRPRTSTSPAGVTVTHTYDDSGLLLSKDYSDATPDVSFGYDLDGRRTSMTDGTGTTTYRFDTAGRLTQVVDGTGTTVGYELDRDGNVVSLTYPNGRSLARTYSPAGRLTGLTDWLGGTTAFSSDAFGQTSGVTYPNGVTGAWTHDAAGAPTSARWTTAAGTVAEFTTPTAGNAGLVSSETSSGPTTSSRSYDYDDRNRLSEVDGLDVQYDFAANLLRSADGTTQRFDLAGQLLSRTPGSADEAGGAPVEVRSTRTATAGPSSQVLRLTDVDADEGDTVVLLVSTGTGRRAVGSPPRAVAGTLRFSRLGNVATSSGDAEVWVAEAPTAARGTVVVPLGADHGTVLASAVTVSGAHDVAFVPAQGRASRASSTVPTRAGDLVLTATAARSTAAVAPTAAPPGTALTSGSDAWSGFRGLLSSAQADRAGDLPVGLAEEADEWALASVRLRSAAAAPQGTSFAYSPTGARQSELVGGTPRAGYTYDAENRLLSVDSGGSVTTATYDGAGLRTSTTSPAAVKRFGYDQSADLPLILDDGATSYVYGDNGMPVAQITGDTATYLLTDTRASVRVLTDATGQVTGAASYGVHGTVESRTGATSALGFQGQYTDDTGLQYLRARYYDPVTAAFLTPDPMWTSSGSRYGFAGGNPVSFADPTGLVTISCADLLAGVVTAGSFGVEGSANWAKAARQRASALGRTLRTSPDPAARSYAASQLRAAGQLSNNAAAKGLRVVARGLPIVGPAVTYGTHMLQGHGQAEAIGGTAGSAVGGVVGGALGGAACTGLAAGTFGIGAATCPVAVGVGAAVGGLLGDMAGSAVGGWIGKQDWF